jgi:hypothetical protein
MSENSETLSETARMDAIRSLQEAIQNLVAGELNQFSENAAAASKAVNEDCGVPYYVQDLGGAPVAAYGPSFTLPGHLSAWVTLPDEANPDHHSSINVYDHLHLDVDGEHKREPTFIVDSDEFPTTLRVRDTQNSLTLEVEPGVSVTEVGDE